LFGAGVFSTGAYELAPTFTADERTAWFTMSTPAYGRLHVIMETTRAGATWSRPEVAAFSGRHGDADPVLSPDGNRLYFLSRRPFPGRPAGRQDFDVWYLERTAAGWSEPLHLAAASGPGEEHYVSAARDGTLYVSAVRPDSRGRGDIYRIPLVDGRYGEPENMGAAINSADHHDTTAFIAPDESYLVFSSFGRPDGQGAGDLYISFRRGGEWTPARNLGPLVNSMRTEYCPVISPDGSYLYFTSERGFADAPLAGALGTAEWQERIASAGNGLGDTYRVAVDELLGDATSGAEDPAGPATACALRPWYELSKHERTECGLR
jgi:Tol biopolymer transport system component